MPDSKPSTIRQRQTAADQLRAADLSDPDADTEVLAQVDTSLPIGARDGEHGHIDGPRGHEAFHAHDDPPGDVAHGHKRGSLLGWTAAVTDYVPPLAASAPNGAASETDPTPAGVPGDAVGTAPEPSAATGSDTAGSGRSTALVGTAAADRRLVSEAKILAELRQQEEVDDQIIADRTHIGALKALVTEAIRQRSHEQGGRQLVPASTISQLRAELQGWAKDRGMAS